MTRTCDQRIYAKPVVPKPEKNAFSNMIFSLGRRVHTSTAQTQGVHVQGVHAPIVIIIILSPSITHHYNHLLANDFVCFVCLFVCFCCHFGLCFIASDVLTIICHLAIVNVCVIIILSIGNTQISILLLCFLYLFVELMITMNE